MLRESFNQDWCVAKEGAEARDRPVGPVTLPYDAMLFEERDPDTKNGGNTGFYPGGIYRYSKTFTAPEDWRERSVILEFEGVYQRSKVYVNGRLAGGRPSGYALFHVALDEFLEFGADNTIEVVADNSDEPNSRWYTGSGIYRPVHLMVGERVHVAPTGVRIATQELSGSTATVIIETSVVNASPVERNVTVVARLIDPEGVALAPVAGKLSVPAHTTGTLRQEVSVVDAALWSPKTPQLHHAEVSIMQDAEVIDMAREEFGIRTLAVDAQEGLRINGVSVKLRGAAIHHDHGVIGAHSLDAADERRIRILKEAGFNAIRSAHNPASRALLRACDRHGVLVMDELADAWFLPKVKHDYSHHFEEWWERDLEALVANAYNHPSVIMYSIGNEISETATPRGIAANREIAKRARELDPTRLITNSVNGFLNLIAPQDDAKIAKKAAAAQNTEENPNKNLIRVLNLLLGILDRMLERIVRLSAVDRRTREIFAEVDVAGYNYMVGRYELDGRLHPQRVIVGSETRAAHTAAIWKRIESLPHVIGDFAWTGWDYIGEAGIAVKQYGTTKRAIYHPYPALLAGEPVIDITGFRQTQSYLDEIGWHLARGPHIAVEPVNHSGEKVMSTGWRATNSIASWSWEGCEGRTATVEVYADAARVELQLNGQTVGTEPSGADEDYLSTFTLPYRPGQLTAIAYAEDGSEIGRRTLSSAGAGLRLALRPESTSLLADGADLAYIPILLTDDAGTLRPLVDRSVTVQVEGAGTLLGLGSAEPITTEGFAGDTHRTFNGRALAVVRAGHRAGEVTVTVTADECEPVQIRLAVLQSDSLPVAESVHQSPPIR
ncbi:glycoside hydrolase family 2 TIM barrel-domain containing protein [Streptomyces sp. NPDC047939]|uniref:glycoside hydrolase family 2 TIM barrel-domain containing protein n=1 Tax=Streptomyces sp. NPDC047939 TaxID=3155381 RepID=UPI000A7E358E